MCIFLRLFTYMFSSFTIWSISLFFISQCIILEFSFCSASFIKFILFSSFYGATNNILIMSCTFNLFVLFFILMIFWYPSSQSTHRDYFGSLLVFLSILTPRLYSQSTQLPTLVKNIHIAQGFHLVQQTHIIDQCSHDAWSFVASQRQVSIRVRANRMYHSISLITTLFDHLVVSA